MSRCRSSSNRPIIIYAAHANDCINTVIEASVLPLCCTAQMRLVRGCRREAYTLGPHRFSNLDAPDQESFIQ